MTGKCEPIKITRQSKLCLSLMDRLDEDIMDEIDEYEQNDDGYPHFGLQNYTVMQAAIVRLRRELMRLSWMLDPWREE